MPGNARQGCEVALPADGNTLLVGGYNDNSGAGAAWVFVRSGRVGTQQGNKLIGTGGTGSTWFQGSSVALSADGFTALTGGYADNSSAGAAWVFTTPTTGVAGDPGSRTLVLHQNYPNPFNPGTLLSFELPVPSLVRLSVLDMLGREVSVLISEQRGTGLHQTSFDGSGLASGVCICRLRSGDVLLSRRLLLLR